MELNKPLLVRNHLPHPGHLNECHSRHAFLFHHIPFLCELAKGCGLEHPRVFRNERKSTQLKSLPQDGNLLLVSLLPRERERENCTIWSLMESPRNQAQRPSTSPRPWARSPGSSHPVPLARRPTRLNPALTRHRDEEIRRPGTGLLRFPSV